MILTTIPNPANVTKPFLGCVKQVQTFDCISSLSAFLVRGGFAAPVGVTGADGGRLFTSLCVCTLSGWGALSSFAVAPKVSGVTEGGAVNLCSTKSVACCWNTNALFKWIAHFKEQILNNDEDQQNRCSEKDHVHLYVDDRVILGECWKQLHGALQDWKELFKKHGLKTNLDKTEVMWVGKQREELNIRLEGNILSKWGIWWICVETKHRATACFRRLN